MVLEWFWRRPIVFIGGLLQCGAVLTVGGPTAPFWKESGKGYRWWGANGFLVCAKRQWREELASSVN